MFIRSVLVSLLISLCHCQIDVNECGITKTCYGIPAGCVSDVQRPCEILFTAVGLRINNSVSMELQAQLKDQSPRWFAIGFSKDQKMGDDAVFDCTFLPDKSVSIRQSYNNGKTNKAMPSDEGTSQKVTRFENDRIFCSWTQTSPVVMKESTFDLLGTPHYFLLATGLLDGNTKDYHDVREYSSSPQDLKVVSLIDTSSASYPVEYIKTHGSLMIVSWMAIVPVGIMFARYFKDAFSASKLCGVKFWFAVHRSFMLAAIICVALASYLSFKFVGGWSGAHLHPILGLTTVCLMVVQLITAILRCSPDSSFRWFFNWSHFLTGNSAHITAIATIFTAYDAISLPPIYLYLVGSYIALHLVTHLIMQARSGCASTVKSESQGSIDIATSESMRQFHTEASKEGGIVARICLIAIYVFGVVAISTALVLVIFDRM